MKEYKIINYIILFLILLTTCPIYTAKSKVRIESAAQGSEGITTSLFADHNKFEINNKLSSSGFTIYVLKLDIAASDVSGETSILTSNTRVLGRFEITLPEAGYAIGYSFESFTAIVIESRYLFIIKPQINEKLAEKLLRLAIKAQGEGTLKVGGFITGARTLMKNSIISKALQVKY